MLVWLHGFLKPTRQEMTLIQCLSLLALGGALSTLATLNFPQAFFIGLLASVLSFVRPLTFPRSWPSPVKGALSIAVMIGLAAISPFTVLYISSHFTGQSVQELVDAAAWASEVERTWTGVMIWVVWWPAWVCNTVVAGSGLFLHSDPVAGR